MIGEEFCVIWGIWLPSPSNKDKVIQFYLNVITKPENFISKFLFFVDLEDKKSELNVDLFLSFMWRSEDTKRPWFSDKLKLIKTKFKDDSSSRKTLIFKNLKNTHKGDGNLSMILLLDKSDEEEINSFLEDKNPDKRLQQGSSTILGKMKCTEKQFEFLEVSTGTSGIGFRILI